MSQTEEDPVGVEIDADTFLSALERRALDWCLQHLERNDANGEPDVAMNCRLAEVLLHQGWREDAVRCVRRAFPAAQNDPALLRICAWVFSNSDCHGEAAAAYRRLLDVCPDWIEGYRHLSGSLAAVGRVHEAIAQAIAAAELAPKNPEYALHAAALLAAEQRYQEAVAWALHAVDLMHGDNGIAIDAAEVLMRCNRADRAAKLLEWAWAGAAEPRLWRVLSTAEMLCGRLDAALDAAEHARAGEPENPEYALHHGHLLWRLGDMAGAARAFEQAAALDPSGRDVKRAQLSLYLSAGLTTEATVAGGELLHRFPDDKSSAEAVLHLLNHRLDTINGEYVVLSDDVARAPRPPPPAPSVLDRLRSQRRVIRALIVRETRTRFADSRLGYGWALIEPILHIALLSATFAVLMNGRPPIGTHFFIFYYTGLIRYYVASATTSKWRLAGNRPKCRSWANWLNPENTASRLLRWCGCGPIRHFVLQS